MKDKTGEFIIILYPDSCDCSIERFNTSEELEEAVKYNYTASSVIACKELELKVVLEEDNK